MAVGMAQKRRVLLVDDEKNLCQMLRMLLETRGFNVDIAFNAQQALQKVSSEIDVIILDVVLPDFDGFEVCRRLKEQEKTRHIPIIMISAHCLYEDKVEGLYLGADDFISKPCEYEELIARIEVVLRRNFIQEMNEANHESDNTIFQLRKVLDEGRIVPYFQPIYQLQPFGLYGLEILSRPQIEGTLKNPEMFFKAAMQFGLYTELEILSWNIAAQQVRKYAGEMKIFLNCNPYLIESSQFLRVKSIFEKNQIHMSNVVLEITERSAITNYELFYNMLDNYRQAGFRFAVDDVGGGYASLESIVETRPEVVKIDRHIVFGAANDPFKQNIIEFIVAMCRENNIFCVAEGIENEEDLSFLRRIGVDAAQGFYLYKPVPEVDLHSFRIPK